MHRKYAAQGLVAVSVSLDEVKDTKVRGKVDKFLQKQEAVFPNFILDASQEEWQDRLKITAIPCVYVFNRDNRIALKQSEEVDYAAIEKTVESLLRQ
jgi:hypothetical protein